MYAIRLWLASFFFVLALKCDPDIAQIIDPEKMRVWVENIRAEMDVIKRRRGWK